MAKRLALLMMLIGFLVTTASAGDPPSQTLVGFRGNWTGNFPEASPPVEWSRISKLVAGLRCQAAPPANDQPAGTPAYFSAVTEWMIAGPIAPADATAKLIDDPTVPNEADLQPANDKTVKGVVWKPVSTSANLIDLVELFGAKAQGVAYGHSYIYSAEEGAVTFRFVHHRDLKAYLNGKQIYPGKGNATATLNKGWNRLLCKISYGDQAGPYAVYPSLWHFGVSIAAASPAAGEIKNIRWQTPLPGPSISTPLVLGDRIYCLAEPGDLICINRLDGKILWIRSTTFYDGLTDEQKNSHPAAKQLDALTARLAEVNAAYVLSPDLKPELAALKWGEKAIYSQITALMKDADPEKFNRRLNEAHGWTVPTPVTDGKNLYLFLGCGIATSYDLDGNRRWASTQYIPIKHHGFNSSPILVGDNFVYYMRKLFAVNKDTGKPAWTNDICKDDSVYSDSFHDSLITLPIAGRQYLYAHATIIDPADGKTLWNGPFAPGNASMPTPLIADGKLFHLVSGGKLSVSKLPASPDKPELKDECTLSFFKGPASDAYRRTMMCASPLYHDGLLYIIDCMGHLFVVDAVTNQLVYTQDLDLGLETSSRVHSMGTAYASPILAGKHIYVLGMSGTSVVFEPGRTFKLIARNKIEQVTRRGLYFDKPEGFPSTPVTDGKNLYLRGDDNLYCIGEI